MNSKLFFNFSKPENYIVKVYIFIWIVLWNVLLHVFEEPLHHVGFASWAFWLANISFFLLEHESTPERIVKPLVGGVVGSILGYITILSHVAFFAPKFGPLGVLIPIVIWLVLIVLLGGFFPAFFNSVAFMYLVVSTIVPETAITNVAGNCVSVIAGSVIMNLGCVLIIHLYTQSLIKKAKAAAAAQAKAE